MSDKTPQSGDHGAHRGFVTLTVGEQLFGIPVLAVRDILSAQRMTKVPQAPAEVAGVLNLRGRIVTAIDLRMKLMLSRQTDDRQAMHVVVEHSGEPYGLVVDTVGDVMELADSDWEAVPRNLDKNLAAVSTGVYRLQGRLLVVIDIGRILGNGHKLAA